MLDSIRYMIVWNPLIFLAFTVLAKLFPHHHIVRHIAVSAGAAASQPPAPGLLVPPAPLGPADVGLIAAGAH